MERAIADLEGIRAAVEVRDWIVVGHSWGCDLAIRYASEHPTTVKAVIGIAGRGPQRDRTWSESAEAGKSTEPTVDVEWVPEVNISLGESFTDWVHRPDLWRGLATCEVPMHLIAAGADPRPAWPLAQLAELLPNGTVSTVPDAGCCLRDRAQLRRGAPPVPEAGRPYRVRVVRRSGERRAAQPRPAQVRARKEGAVEVCALETCVVQVRAPEIRALEMRSVKVGVAEVCAPEVALLESGVVELGVCQDGVGHVRVVAAAARAAPVGIAEDRVRQVRWRPCFCEVRRDIRLNDRVAQVQ